MWDALHKDTRCKPPARISAGIANDPAVLRRARWVIEVLAPIGGARESQTVLGRPLADFSRPQQSPQVPVLPATDHRVVTGTQLALKVGHGHSS
jgi:hypothetical protein